jgi:hypothetical protein
MLRSFRLAYDAPPGGRPAARQPGHTPITLPATTPDFATTFGEMAVHVEVSETSCCADPILFRRSGAGAHGPQCSYLNNQLFPPTPPTPGTPQAQTGIAPPDQEWHFTVRAATPDTKLAVALAPSETKGADAGDADKTTTAVLEQLAAMPPRRWTVLMVATWIQSLPVFTPDEKRRLNRGRFAGYNLVGSNDKKYGTQPLTENDVHKAMGVIPCLTADELKAAFEHAGIPAGKVPEFERDIDNGETLYDQFKDANSLQSITNDYFQSDELRPLAEALWADLTLIDDASRARDARRVFAILEPLLKDLRARQEKGEDDEAFIKEQEGMEGRHGEASNRRYAAAEVVSDSGDDSDGSDGGGVAGGGGAAGSGSGTKGKKTGGKGGGGTKQQLAPRLDLVARAFASTAGAALPASPSPPTDTVGGTTLEDWTAAVEKKDWAGMKMCGGVFTHASSTYGQCIIEGRVDTGDMQVFTAKKMGGIAGGKKFVVKNILFKFADPMGGPYNNSFELSQKAAAHDLRGATAFLHYQEDLDSHRCVSVSLQTLIDFAGFRLQAMQMLPIDGSTLIIGTGDACESLPHADPEACTHFKKVADNLGLAEHEIKVVHKDEQGNQTARLHFGADVEGHRGKDGKLYVLDTARTFPSECFLTTTYVLK